MTGDPLADDLRAEAVRVLTAAAHRLGVDGTPCDFADFLAGVLGATTANLGGVGQLLAGRPGSWEAALVRSLVAGTLGGDPGRLWRARIEPLVVPLNVAEMLEHLDLHPGLLTVDETVEACDRRHHGDDPQEATVAAEAAAIAVPYEQQFAAYAERFAAAVQAATAAITGLAVPVQLSVDSDPWSRWWTHDATTNPTAGDDDPLVVNLWWAAHDNLPLPNVDIDMPTTQSASPSNSRSVDVQRS